MPYRISACALAALAAAICGCADPRKLASEGGGSGICSACHGSAANAAPPADTRGNSDPSAVGVGAHQAHVTAPSGLSAPLDCVFCHQKPSNWDDPGHLDGLVTVTGYTGADPIWQAAGADPGWKDSSRSCSTSYCHGAFPGGNAGNAPVWTRVGQHQADCGTCHGLPPPSHHPDVPSDSRVCNVCHPLTVDASGGLIAPAAGGKHLDGLVESRKGHGTSWMDQGSSDFHAYSANRGLAECQVCHGQDLAGGLTGVACGDCHDKSLPAGVTTWKRNCVMCHGGNDNQTGAPPRATWGNAAPIAAGAHTSHVAATHGLSLPLDCNACHLKPPDALAAGHVDGAVTVTGYTGGDPTLLAAVEDPGWSAANASCTTSYCHGSFPGGNGSNAPLWTSVGGTQAACGTCHDNPPRTGRHYEHTNGEFASADCKNCHYGIATGSGTPPVVNAALGDVTLHVNGVKNVVFGDWYGGFPVGGYPQGTTATFSNGTCANISCHRLLNEFGPWSWNP